MISNPLCPVVLHKPAVSPTKSSNRKTKQNRKVLQVEEYSGHEESVITNLFELHKQESCTKHKYIKSFKSTSTLKNVDNS